MGDEGMEGSAWWVISGAFWGRVKTGERRVGRKGYV